MKRSRLVMGTAVVAVASGCATPESMDYTAFQAAKPATLLVLPPMNNTADVKATPGVWASATRPLAEAGYYVLPVALVDETLRQNGIDDAGTAREIPPQKLRQVFGADAVVYLTVKHYGTGYAVVSSETRVTVEGTIVDLRNGEKLWTGAATASSAEQQQQSQGGLIGLLVQAIVKQIIEDATDRSFDYGAIANARLLNEKRVNGILPGPRSPLHGQAPNSRR